jgi:uncharacterized protein YlxP (DUF503 family)
MPIGILTLHLYLAACTSLKEKRGRLKPVLSRLHRDFNLSVAEIGHQDRWQESIIMCALVSNQSSFIQSVLDKVSVDVDHNNSNVQLLESKIDLI